MIKHLEDITFAEGTVDRWTFANDELSLYFTDKQSEHLVLRFSGGVEVSEKGSIDRHIIGSSLDKAGDRRTFRLLEEDWGVVLTITFRECRITS
jgi:hypothetical protein